MPLWFWIVNSTVTLLINKQTEEMFISPISQYKTAKGTTEHLKAKNQMEWVYKKNNTRDRISEIIYKELICV